MLSLWPDELVSSPVASSSLLSETITLMIASSVVALTSLVSDSLARDGLVMAESAADISLWADEDADEVAGEVLRDEDDWKSPAAEEMPLVGQSLTPDDPLPVAASSLVMLDRGILASEVSSCTGELLASDITLASESVDLDAGSSAAGDTLTLTLEAEAQSLVIETSSTAESQEGAAEPAESQD